MKWSPDDRQAFLRRLDAVEHGVVIFYRFLLGVIVAAVVAVVAFVVARRPWGAGSQGEWFYFSVVVLLVLGWVVRQFISLSRRRRSPPPVTTDLWDESEPL